MKTIFYSIALSVLVAATSSCSKVDNYAAPDVTLKGVVTDAATGKSVQTEQGSGTRIKLLEISWSSNPTPFYISSFQDGTYTNTKLFAGKNVISAEGPFVPMVQVDNNGKTIVDKSQTVDVKGVTTVNFSVDPFLRIDWVGDPVLNADGTITTSFKITRGTSDPNFQQDVSDVAVFVNSNKYVGNNNFDNRYTPTLSGSNANSSVGKTISLTTIGGPLPGKRQYFIRVAARIAYGLNYYNYTDVKVVTVP
ncbi:DUF3823 domain-containing protein [Mucilaginibacter sp. HC2]|uniref:DUF3823 domain-containing protein n=1 Tax=Mucilaginibacter inviolabilis TaxID=2714892 RepID=UPI00140C3570|nr:DUF3823 domain-containing protein [Mucilaginibacter inviolabilis]NHA05342.1 DUF3823 domain-containing protein [Mucilaginibacter inviolabilis]